MSVESVNGKVGVVTLLASDVSAIAASEAGASEGVAQLDGTGVVPQSQLPSSVVRSKVKALGSVSGSVALNVAEGNLFTATLTGATTFKTPENIPSGNSPIQIIVNSGTGFSFSFEGLEWVGTEPTAFASGAASSQYLISIVPVAGKLLAVLGKGETGATGATGAAGESGPAGPEAMTCTSFPWISQNAKCVGHFAPTKYKAYSQLVVVPLTKKKLKVKMPFGVVSGHVRTFVYDMGATTAGKYTCVAASTLYEPKTAEKQELIATLERKDGKEWKAGECLIIGVAADNETITFGNNTALSKGPEAEYEGGDINGTAGLTKVLVSCSHTFSESGFSKENPEEFGEGSMATSATVLAFLCRWE